MHGPGPEQAPRRRITKIVKPQYLVMTTNVTPLTPFQAGLVSWRLLGLNFRNGGRAGSLICRPKNINITHRDLRASLYTLESMAFSRHVNTLGQRVTQSLLIPSLTLACRAIPLPFNNNFCHKYRFCTIQIQLQSHRIKKQLQLLR